MRGSRIPVVSNGKVLEDAYNIISDNKSGMYDMMEHLIDEHSVQKVSILSGTRDNYDALARRDAVIEIMEKRGYPVPKKDISIPTGAALKRKIMLSI